MNLVEQAARLYKALISAAEQIWPHGSDYVSAPRHVHDAFGLDEAVGVLVRDPTGRRSIDLFPVWEESTWIEFRDGENVSQSEIVVWLASSPDPGQDAAEVEFVFKLLNGDYRSARHGLLRRHYLVVDTALGTYELAGGWPVAASRIWPIGGTRLRRRSGHSSG